MCTSSAEVGKEGTIRKYMYMSVYAYTYPNTCVWVYMYTHAYTGIVFLYVHDHYWSI